MPLMVSFYLPISGALTVLTKRHVRSLKFSELAVHIGTSQVISLFRKSKVPLQDSRGATVRGAKGGGQTYAVARLVLRCGGGGKCGAELGAEMLEESGDDGQTADDDADRELDVGPHSKWDKLIAEIRGLGDPPGVVRSDDGGNTRARY